MSKIIQLDEHLSNMIAAGEVVERVSSVVKELCENALDAKASEIIIELVDSGIKQICVTDNGCGMDKEDLLLCTQRHATSKIKNQYDLFRIKTLGFRGEALPSIAAVSDLTIKSNCGDIGYYVHLRATKKIDEGSTPLNRGTEITVKDLFYNTPARLKYLKGEAVELASVCDCVDKLALSNLNVRFKLINNGKILLQTSGSNDMKNIMGNIYGLSAIKGLMEIENEKNGIKLKCFLTQPVVNKSRKNAITLIVNGRCVKNYSIINAVTDGYDTYIPQGRYPVAVIFLNLDSMLIDVNVHPTKQEIRISSEDEIKSLITQTIKSALFKTRLIPEMKFEEKKETFINDEPKTYEKKIEKIEYEVQNLFEEEPELKRLPTFEYIGQYAGTYLLFQNEEGLFLMDQHAAAERIRYEKYIEALSNPSSICQEMFIPEIMEVTKEEKIFILNNLEKFKELGIELTEASESSFYLRSVPAWIISDDPATVAEEMVSFIINKNSIDIKSMVDDLAKSISCKGAIKANRNLERDEVNALVAQLSLCKNPFTCPHGRPTIITFSEREIEKMFLRVL